EVLKDREGAASALAKKTGAVVVLKGAGTVVTDGERVYVNTTGNPGMATAGSGDVLTGAIASLLAQGIAAVDGRVLGVLLLEAAARRAVDVAKDPATPEDADDAVRVLAGIGRAALPHVVRGLAGASWHARAALVAAVAEMDATDATPLLVAACRDPAFAVRE